MAEYIERELANEVCERAYHEWNLAMAAADGKREINHVFKMQELCKAVKAVVGHIPAADVVPVVRCKDCKYAIPSFCGLTRGTHLMCRRQDEYWKPDDFCSYGERESE